jgi:ribosomal-protein-serine acetyltransferase
MKNSNTLLDNFMTRDRSFIIRPCQPHDAEVVFDAVRESMKELLPWMPWCRRDYGIEDSRSWCGARPDLRQNGQEYDFLIADRTEDRPLGICGLNNLDRENGLANLGYWVRTSRVRQGVATACVPQVARFGFEELKLNRIEIIVATGNIPSQGLAMKIGAVREGRLRKRLVVRDHVYDAVLFSLLPEDFPLGNGKLTGC